MDDDDLTVSDGEIMEEMKNLELMIAFHKKVVESGNKVSLYIPDGLGGYLNLSVAKSAWDTEDYDSVREIYAGAWINYYETIFGDEIFYTPEQFAEMFKVD